MKTIFFVAFLFVATDIYSQQIKSVKVTELEKLIKESKRPLIISFWATFCVPCLQELPYFQDITEKYKSQEVSMLLVSLDLKGYYPDSIMATVKKHKIVQPVVWLNETNADYFCPKIDSSWSGGMPSSLFVNNATGYHKFFEESLSKEKFEKEIQAMLKPK
jgi:thiol-disulfide isomerase/thioredoxin